MTNWIDITQPLTNTIAHWPEDTPFSYTLTCTKEETGSTNVGQMTTSLHMGTHVDAPFHFDNDGATINQLNLNHYIGKTTIIDVSHTDTITPGLLETYTWDQDVGRLLLKTNLPNKPERFPNAIPMLDPAIAPWLQEHGIHLLGVDMPSVDPIDSKTLPTHHKLAQHDVFILENVMLDTVEPGHYDLIALPLAIQGADGSPVRAVIRPIEKGDV